MGRDIYNGDEELPLLEGMLPLHSDFRRHLEPIRVAATLCGGAIFLCRHAEANLTDAAVTLPGSVHNRNGEKEIRPLSLQQ